MSQTLRSCLIGLTLTVTWGGTASAGPIPAPLRGVIVSTTVSTDARTGIFTYQYRVFNPPTNDGQIFGIDIEINRGTGDAILPSEGLVNGAHYLAATSENARQLVPMVPVGVVGPNGWLAGLGHDNQTPAHGFAGWGSEDPPFRILPGQTLGGFQLTSYGLPGIRPVIIQPAIPYDDLPEEFEGDVVKARELQEQLLFRDRTVGPKAPPATFVPLEFLNYLITLVHDSRQQGWIRRDEAHKNLVAKLLDVKRKLEREAGEETHKEATEKLGAFLHEVQGLSCRQFSCRGNKPLTSEAYALLFFNGQHLCDRLQPPGSRCKTPEAHGDD